MVSRSVSGQIEEGIGRHSVSPLPAAQERSRFQVCSANAVRAPIYGIECSKVNNANVFLKHTVPAHTKDPPPSAVLNSVNTSWG